MANLYNFGCIAMQFIIKRSRYRVNWKLKQETAIPDMDATMVFMFKNCNLSKLLPLDMAWQLE